LHKCNTFPDEYAVYRELDYISKNEVLLQSHLYQELEKIDTSRGEGFFYDITSSYMEGSQCVIAKLGYSRDHRPDKEQIVIALMITPQGSPFYWKVLDGNTQDVTTLPSVVNDLKKRFNLESCHLVFDRGMVSSEHLEYLEGESVTYLTAMDKDEIACHPLFNELMPHPVTIEDYKLVLPSIGFKPTDDSENFYTQEGVDDKRKYIFSFDATRFAIDIKNRDKRMTQITNWVSEKNKNLLCAKKTRKLEPLERDIKNMIKRRKFKNLLQINITPISLPVTNKNGTVRTIQSYQLKLTIDTSNYDRSRRLDGITCFITNIPELPHTNAIQKYREKNKIEEAFREMKSALALRPIYLTRTERVRAHVSVCVLAYLLMNTMEIMLKKEQIHNTSVDVLNKMMSCQLNEVGFQNSSEYSIVMTQITDKQKQLIELLKCSDYLKPNYIKILTQFMKKSL